MMRFFGLGGCLALAFLLPAAGIASGSDDAVQVKVVKYTGLGETVSQLKGKVVVIDFWADT
jgi:pantoate kinase